MGDLLEMSETMMELSTFRTSNDGRQMGAGQQLEDSGIMMEQELGRRESEQLGEGGRTCWNKSVCGRRQQVRDRMPTMLAADLFSVYICKTSERQVGNNTQGLKWESGGETSGRR